MQPAFDIFRGVIDKGGQADRVIGRDRIDPLSVMKISDLLWWAWLLSAAIFGFLSADGLVGIIGKRAMDRPSIVLALVLLVLGILCAVVGFVRFVKWAWKPLPGKLKERGPIKEI